MRPLVHHLFVFRTRRAPSSTLFPYTTLFRSLLRRGVELQPAGDTVMVGDDQRVRRNEGGGAAAERDDRSHGLAGEIGKSFRSEEHTSELQSHVNLVCRLLLEKKKPVEREHPG